MELEKIRQKSPIAISDFNIFPGEKPPDPGASTPLTGRSKMLPEKKLLEVKKENLALDKRTVVLVCLNTV